jgi:hypothetical protein
MLSAFFIPLSPDSLSSLHNSVMGPVLLLQMPIIFRMNPQSSRTIRTLNPQVMIRATERGTEHDLILKALLFLLHRNSIPSFSPRRMASCRLWCGPSSSRPASSEPGSSATWTPSGGTSTVHFQVVGFIIFVIALGLGLKAKARQGGGSGVHAALAVVLLVAVILQVGSSRS